MQKMVRVHARTILGDAERTMDVATQTLTEDVARSLANAFQLPQNVPWALRDDTEGTFLDESAAIGSHVREGVELKTVVTPKAHLG